MGFAVPLAKWFRGPLRERLIALLKNRDLDRYELFDLRFIENAVDEHLAGKRDHSALLWALLMFDVSCRKLDIV